MNLYVSNLAYTVSDDDLRNVFEAYGAVTSARVINDRETGRSRGFGFVEMPNDHEAIAAINDANNLDLSGRPMKVVEARPKEARPQGGGGGGGGGGRSFGGGGGQRRDFDGGGRRDFGGGGGGGRSKDRDWDRERGGKDRDWDRGGGGGGGGRRRGGNDYEDEGW